MLALGNDLYNKVGKNIAGCQVLSGTGGLRLGFEFCKRYVP